MEMHFIFPLRVHGLPEFCPRARREASAFNRAEAQEADPQAFSFFTLSHSPTIASRLLGLSLFVPMLVIPTFLPPHPGLSAETPSSVALRGCLAGVSH